ncbi:hypothetical protein L2E82_02819 [Cichorium intybus]|uniref:Uncharacterized protein n=1 Tax=Cichorium intybus TaxID=13427 RepID=A0ACB9H2U9_CICIN|nr:hypothetical protein L2E82_02819 [Cichorium intybus]
MLKGERQIYFTKSANQLISSPRWDESFTERYTYPTADQQEALLFVIGKRSGRTIIVSATVNVSVPPKSNVIADVLNTKGKPIGRLRLSFRPEEASNPTAARPPARSRSSKIFSTIYKASMIGQAIIKGIEFFTNM